MYKKLFQFHLKTCNYFQKAVEGSYLAHELPFPRTFLKVVCRLLFVQVMSEGGRIG